MRAPETLDDGDVPEDRDDEKPRKKERGMLGADGVREGLPTLLLSRRGFLPVVIFQ
jgi:hypothetical protein